MVLLLHKVLLWVVHYLWNVRVRPRLSCSVSSIVCLLVILSLVVHLVEAAVTFLTIP